PAPQVLAVGVEAGEVDVRLARAHQRAAAEVEAPVEAAAEEHPVVAGDRAVVADLMIRGVEGRAPAVVALGVELGDEDVLIAAARQRRAAEVEGPPGVAGDYHGAGLVDRDAADRVEHRAADRAAPAVVAVAVEAGDETVDSALVVEGEAAEADARAV